MRKAVERLLFFLFFCTPYPGAAQPPYALDKTNAALRRHCAFCSYGLTVDYDPASLWPLRSAGMETFHKSHEALQRHRPEAAFRYAQRTVAALNHPAQDPLYAPALFLWAKTNALKGLTQSATGQYERFLGLTQTDSVLRGDAYASLAGLYVQQQNWEKADSFLRTWQRYYLPLTDAKTAAGLFDRVANAFNDSLLRQPEAAFRMGTELFTKQKDTIRLSLFCYNAAHWYAQRSNEAAAIAYLKYGVRLALLSRDYKAQKFFYRDLALLEEKRSQSQTASRYNKAYEAAADSLYQSGPLPDAFYLQKKKLLRFIEAPSALRQETVSGSANGQGVLFVVLAALVLFFLPAVHQSHRVPLLQGEVQRLTEANESKNTLLSVVAHDLRSSVHALQLNIGKLKTVLEKGLIKEALALTGTAEQLATAVHSLLNNVLYWSLSQLGQLSHRPEPVALQPLLNSVCYDLLPLAAAKNIALHYTLEGNLTCLCDVNAAKLIFRNLIDNAIKYTPVRGTVTLSAKSEKHLCAVTVADTGIGMAPHIIEALFTAKDTRIQQDTGGRRSTGIGLRLAKNMAEQNGGALRVSSVAGAGTAVTVTLPMVS